MITVTRRNGTAFALNPDLIERVEATPDTVITLVSGTRYAGCRPRSRSVWHEGDRNRCVALPKLP